MIAEDIFVSDSRISSIQHISLRFAFKVEGGKLIIQSLCLDDQSQYFGNVSLNPHLTFAQIQENLRGREFRIMEKSQDELRLRVEEIYIELFSKSKLEINQLTEMTKTLNERHEQFDELLRTQIDEVRKLKDEMAKMEIRELKETVRKSIEKQSTFENFVQSQTNEVRNLKNEMKDFKVEIKKMMDETKVINQNLITSEMKKVSTQIKNLENETNFKLNDQSTKIKRNSEDIERIMQEVKQVMTKMNIPCLNNSVGFNSAEKEKKKEEKKPIEILNVVNNNKINLKSEREKELPFKWSQELKSNLFKINGNVTTLTKRTDYYEFCLLNASFSNTIKSKQSWAIKINNKTRWIELGVCLKSKMLEYTFNTKNINWLQTGHGLYMIGSDGFCLSHSEKEFNNVKKSFKFVVNDVIYVEYDPIDLKLRFSKNKEKYFEMSIIAPPENDAYHPCVGLYVENNSVELIEQKLN